MRNPERIDEYCNQLAELWGKVPDWRFGQLMMNMLSEFQTEHSPSYLFNVEDEQLFQYMKKWIKNNCDD